MPAPAALCIVGREVSHSRTSSASHTERVPSLRGGGNSPWAIQLYRADLPIPRYARTTGLAMAPDSGMAGIVRVVDFCTTAPNERERRIKKGSRPCPISTIGIRGAALLRPCRGGAIPAVLLPHASGQSCAVGPQGVLALGRPGDLQDTLIAAPASLSVIGQVRSRSGRRRHFVHSCPASQVAPLQFSVVEPPRIESFYSETYFWADFFSHTLETRMNKGFAEILRFLYRLPNYSGQSRSFEWPQKAPQNLFCGAFCFCRRNAHQPA